MMECLKESGASIQKYKVDLMFVCDRASLIQ